MHKFTFLQDHKLIAFAFAERQRITPCKCTGSIVADNETKCNMFFQISLDFCKKTSKNMKKGVEIYTFFIIHIRHPSGFGINTLDFKLVGIGITQTEKLTFG